jgi:xylose isomerase
MQRKYAAILGNLGNTRDRFCANYKKANSTSIEMLKQAAEIDGVTGIELVGTWDVSPENFREMRRAINDLGLKCVSIIPDLFSDPLWRNGTLSCRDAGVREKSMDYLRKMADIALEMDCQLLNVWPGQDGYDYLFQANYLSERQYLTENLAVIAARYPQLKFAIEYKPKEPRTHSYVARMADTLLLCLQTGCDNVGVTIDTGHAFVAGENVSEAIALAKFTGDRLFHMHFNDNYKSWDDDMITGTVHTIEYLEMLYFLDECGYDGWLSMDQYPYREDAKGAIQESINWLKYYDSLLESSRDELRQTIDRGDAVKTSAVLRNIFSGNSQQEQM